MQKIEEEGDSIDIQYDVNGDLRKKRICTNGDLRYTSM